MKTIFDSFKQVRVRATDESGDVFTYAVFEGNEIPDEDLEQLGWRLEGCEYSFEYYLPWDDNWYEAHEVQELIEMERAIINTQE